MLITHGWCRRWIVAVPTVARSKRSAAYTRLKRCRFETVEEYSAQQPLEGCLLLSDYSPADAEMPCPFILGTGLIEAQTIGFIIECTNRKSTSIPKGITQENSGSRILHLSAVVLSITARSLSRSQSYEEKGSQSDKKNLS